MSIVCEAFKPHSYAQIAAEGVYPPGSVPEPVYAQLIRKYEALEGVDISRITYPSDGLAITGIAALPAYLKPKSHPLVIYNRGGSMEYGKLTVLNVVNLLAPLAQEGCLTFASNYRGNDGSEGREEFGGRDVHDVLSLLDLASRHPAWNGTAYMVGHSRGGMMTYLALKAGAKVNAACSISGIADLLNWDVRSDWLDRLIHTTGEERETALRERSATCWPEALTTPLLLLHGDVDEAVSHTQSLALAEKLKDYGQPHALHIYPGGNHALVRQWQDVTQRLTGWFALHGMKRAAA